MTNAKLSCCFLQTHKYYRCSTEISVVKLCPPRAGRPEGWAGGRTFREWTRQAQEASEGGNDPTIREGGGKKRKGWPCIPNLAMGRDGEQETQPW